MKFPLAFGTLVRQIKTLARRMARCHVYWHVGTQAPWYVNNADTQALWHVTHSGTQARW